MVPVERAQDVRAHDLVRRAARCSSVGEVDDPVHHRAAVRSSRGPRARRRRGARWRRGGRAPTISWTLFGSRFASGSSRNNSEVRLISAWAMRTRCCSPPERLPTRAVGETRRRRRRAVRSSTRARCSFESARDAEPLRVEPEGDEVARAHGHVGIEHHLLGDVAERSAPLGQRRAVHANRRPIPVAGARGWPAATWSCRRRSIRSAR